MEKSPKLKNKVETTENESVEEVESALDLLDEHVTQLQREGSEIDISAETTERIEKKAGKIKSLLKVASVTLALYGSYDVGTYATSRYEITAEVSQDGNTEFEHEDPETTRILNFLTGKSVLSQEDRILFYRERVRGTYERLLVFDSHATFGLEEQKVFEESLPDDEQGLKNLMIELLLRRAQILGEPFGHDEIQKDVDMVFASTVKSKVEYSPELEKLLWDMQKKVGAPRIRWAAPTDNLYSKVHGSLGGPGRANYSLYDNTVYITPDAYNSVLQKTLLAENAHAFQFNENPVTSRARYVVDSIKTLATMVRDNKSYYEAQHEQYENPKSIEYEAHQVLEEKLLNEALEEERRLKDKS